MDIKINNNKTLIGKEAIFNIEALGFKYTTWKIGKSFVTLEIEMDDPSCDSSWIFLHKNKEEFLGYVEEDTNLELKKIKSILKKKEMVK